MTFEAVPLIPRSVLFADPSYTSPQISPDGTRLGYLAPRDGVLNVYVGPLDDPSAARPLTNDRGQGIRWYGFCADDRNLFYLQDADGDENWRLYLLDLDNGEERCVTPFEQVTVQVLEHNRFHPTAMLLGINKDNPELHDVYRLDLIDGSLTKVEANPGFFGWLIDTDLAVRGAVAMTEDGGHQLFRRDEPAGEFVPWLVIPPEDAIAASNHVSFSRSGETMYMVSSVDANAGRLLEVDMASGELTVMAEDSAYDVDSLEWDPQTRAPLAVVFVKDRQDRVFLDPGFESEFAQLKQRLGADGEITLDRRERDDRIWLVSLAPSDGPVSYYRYRRDTAELTFLFHDRPELGGYQLARMEPFAFTARDGLRVHGYVTFPPGVPARDLPAVLDVHGGPWGRNTWRYDVDAQWLANRGYACVHVNFRGSTGYGKAFVNAANKQWGRTMQTDLLDAIDHLAGQGTIDRGRVAIMGGSYGGYAALAGAAFTPDVFRCAIDLCGPANLLTLLASIPPYWRPIARMFHTRMGDPETEQDMLAERSPLSAADQIKIPVLVAQGANDVRVKQAEAEQIVAAMRRNGVPHEYLLFEDEGHGLARPENRERYYAAAERFLAEQLGGRMEP